MWALCAGAHLRFFRQLCTSAKVHEVARLALEALKEGHCVVIGLQSTGELRCVRFMWQGKASAWVHVDPCRGR